jgi:multidrug efflux pump subunit AcrA (membrane-fusion protein)
MSPFEFIPPLSVPPIVTALLARLRTLRLPRQIVYQVALGLCAIAAAQHPLATETSAIASLDSAIAASSRATEDESSAKAAHLRTLVSERRDLQIAASRMLHPWRLMYGGGVGLVILAMLAGLEVLVFQLVRPPSGSARPVD